MVLTVSFVLLCPGSFATVVCGNVACPRPRADFERPWRVFLSGRTEADFQAWRHQRDWTARQYGLWDAGKRLPPNESEPGKPCSIYLKCPCGDIFNSHCLEENLVHVPHVTAAEAALSAQGHAAGGIALCIERRHGRR